DGRHPRRRRRRGSWDWCGRRGAAPSAKMRTRASRIDARGRAEVFSKVEQHVDHAGPHLPGRLERPNVIAVADDLPLASKHAVDGERQSDREPMHAATSAAWLVSLDDEVAMVLLNRK